MGKKTIWFTFIASCLIGLLPWYTAPYIVSVSMIFAFSILIQLIFNMIVCQHQRD